MINNRFNVVYHLLCVVFKQINMENEKKILLGKKGEDKYKGWVLPLNTWNTIQKMWFKNGEIKVWNKKIKL